MPSRRKRARAEIPGKERPLDHLLDKSEQVEEKIEEASVDLTDVNQVLKEGATKATPIAEVAGALEQSAAVEEKVKEAADELEVVNDALSDEIDARHAIEDELSVSQAALAASQVQEKRTRHEAMHDSVTGLPNLTLFKDRLTNAISQAYRHTWQVAVMFIDLDHFKELNDTHGHDFGDAVLRMVAGRLQEFIRGGDTVSRRSGDEFLFLMLEAKDEANARTMAHRISAVLAAPAVVNGVELTVRSSVGLAMYPDNGTTVADLLKHADLAMYEAKRQTAVAVAPRPKD